jgi:hypothetical protein
MAAWQPILSPPWVIGTFLVIFAIFTPLGVLILLASNGVVEIEEDYTDKCKNWYVNTTTGARNCTVNLEFRIHTPMKAPIYMYYKLENFYQNHRRYASSRDDYQLAGNIRKASQLGDCSPIVVYGPDQSVTDVPDDKVYNPCGLIAWSMFNDTFVLKNATTTICDGPQSEQKGSLCTKKGIAWSSDVDVKFKAPKERKNRMYPQDYYNETGHIIPDIADEDFIVWMRTAALPNFRKLYRIINTDLNNGIYHIEIEERYPVKEFGGRKKIILSTSSWIGGKNLFLAIAYLSVAGICVLLALVFSLASCIFYRKNVRRGV